MITINKASAGSGKTYALAHKYIDQILGDLSDPAKFNPLAYRNVLAVTFTNKATDEMKSRILKYLYTYSKENNERGRRSRIVLGNILHDYSSFNISTIDKFFQQTLRCFARELGQFASYQVELDKKSIANEAVDSLLDSLSTANRDDEILIDFILNSVEESVMDGHSANIEKGLKEMAEKLNSEAFNLLAERLSLDPARDYSTESLKILKAQCRKLMASFEDEARQRCKSIVECAHEHGFEPEDFNQKSKSWVCAISKCALQEKGERMKDFSASVWKNMLDPDSWFGKNKSDEKVKSALIPHVNDLQAFWNDNFKLYNTSKALLGNIYGLGIAARLAQSYAAVKKERNVVCLDESNLLLKQIIDGSDAPFVYEKVGTWLDHFLLDEFQDTSATQWENFLPLLRESNSRGGNNLIVGDVKQSIYRWRGADWSLLDRQVTEEFPESVVTPLDKNYRSDGVIIDFNNALYPDIADMLDSMVKTPTGRTIREIYSDVCQQKPEQCNADSGYVECTFYEESEAQLDKILAIVNDLRDNHGAFLSDIAVLVRDNKAGTLVAQKLIDNGIDVVTEDALVIKNSISVRRIVSLMSYVDNPDDTVNSLVASELGLEGVPQSYHSLGGLCDQLYALLCSREDCREACEKEVMYICAFVDYLADYAASHGNNLRAFLSHWEQANPNVNSPLQTDAVKILTIHKSKGLDFPYVIMPYVEAVSLYWDSTTKWCAADIADEHLSEARGKAFHVRLSSGSANTVFSSEYESELYNQAIDALNVLYVGTTRASKALFMLATIAKKGKKNNMGVLLYDWCNQSDYSMGQIPAPEHEKAPVADYTLSYPFHSIGGRLSVRPYAADFFENADKAIMESSPRQRGIVLHDILSGVVEASDLRNSVEIAVAEGSLSESDKEQVYNHLSACIASRMEYFPPASSGVKVLTEVDIIASDGIQYRPDRVLIYPDGRVLIIDYKFGSMKPQYTKQVEGYAILFHQMGYKTVETAIWLVGETPKS